ncbi:MAG: hypothetical protein II799_01485 [Lachnospiraceae bacterium]|nr:hypothetical protein [Lachnospiraceae bacterium]
MKLFHNFSCYVRIFYVMRNIVYGEGLELSAKKSVILPAEPYDYARRSNYEKNI